MAHDDDLISRVREASRELSPIPTETEAQLTPIPGIRAVLFDVYGTLVVSGSGDVGTTVGESRGARFAAALKAVGGEVQGDREEASALWIEAIREDHTARRQQGIEYPEVDVREIWQTIISRLAESGRLSKTPDESQVFRLALEYELLTNPVWPMPAAMACLQELSHRGLSLGIVSNAQFFTPLLFPALFDHDLAELGFSPELCFFSYEFRQAKPGDFLYERAADQLRKTGVTPAEVLYVGNDLLNDVSGASRAGFRTALFAGDARSLRRREGDERVRGVTPDLILTHLNQLAGCLPDQGAIAAD